MSAGALQDLVDTLAARLGRSVAVDDPAFHLIVASRHFGDEDRLRVYSILNRSVPDEARDSVLVHGVAEWYSPGRVPGHERLGYTERVCAPVRHKGELLGYLWLIDPHAAVTPEEFAATAEAADMLGELIHVRRDNLEQDHVSAGSLARAFVFGDTAERADAVRQLWFPDHEDPQLVAVAVESCAEDADHMLRTAFGAAARKLPCTSVLPFVRAGAGYALFTYALHAREIDPTAHGRTVRAGLDCEGHGVPTFFVGVSTVAAGWASAPELHRQAIEALEVGRRRDQDALAWEDLGADPLLLRLASKEQPPEWPGADLVRRLLGDRGNTALLETAEAYLDCAADARQAAARMYVHRTTLYYRLQRIEETTGLDLSDGDDRLTLHVAVRLHRLAQFRQ